MDQYMPPVGINTVMRAITIGKCVMSSDESKLAVGDYVSAFGGVQEYSLVNLATDIGTTVNPVVPGVPLSYNLSILSMVIGTNATSFDCLRERGRGREGEREGGREREREREKEREGERNQKDPLRWSIYPFGCRHASRHCGEAYLRKSAATFFSMMRCSVIHVQLLC